MLISVLPKDVSEVAGILQVHCTLWFTVRRRFHLLRPRSGYATGKSIKLTHGPVGPCSEARKSSEHCTLKPNQVDS